MELEDRGDVAILRLRGGKANAMTRVFLDQLLMLIDRAEASAARAFVMTGYERFFSAGLALPELVGLDRPAMRDFMQHFDRAMSRVFACDRPVIAAINGHAIAGGCVLALMADVRIMATGPQKIGLNETQLGIGLPSVVIEPLLFHLPATSLPRIALEGALLTPEQAQALGLVSEVLLPIELEARAYVMANNLAKAPRSGVSQVKRALRQTAIKNIDGKREQDLDEWLDTWFSPEGRAGVERAAAQLKA
jgi:enoyl-CoA hydratase